MNFKSVNLSILLIVVACAGCKPNGIPRPDTPLCTVEGTEGTCTDTSGDYNVPSRELLCTTGSGYSSMQRHLDLIEREIIKLRRRCGRSKKE